MVIRMQIAARTYINVTMFPIAVRTSIITRTTQVAITKISLHLGSPWQAAIFWSVLQGEFNVISFFKSAIAAEV